MKNRMIELLSYPRQMLHDDIDLVSCLHAGFYDKQDRGCRECENEAQCRWLSANDKFVALERKPVRDLAQSLAFVLDYMNLRIGRWGHDPNVCKCSSCCWFCEASDVFGKVSPIQRPCNPVVLESMVGLA